MHTHITIFFLNHRLVPQTTPLRTVAKLIAATGYCPSSLRIRFARRRSPQISSETCSICFIDIAGMRSKTTTTTKKQISTAGAGKLRAIVNELRETRDHAPARDEPPLLVRPWMRNNERGPVFTTPAILIYFICSSNCGNMKLLKLLIHVSKARRGQFVIQMGRGGIRASFHLTHPLSYSLICIS